MSSHTLTDAEFHQLAHAVLARVEVQIDQWLEADVIDIDSHRSGGLLELSLPNNSKIVLNTQPPLHEIWLAARGGGFHFKYDGQVWRDTKSGDDFFACLSSHLSAQAGKALSLA